MVLPSDLKLAVETNPVLSEVLSRWAEVALPDCWVVAGAVVQSYWNMRHDFPPLYGISDIDLIYYDPDDLGEASEAAHAARIAERFTTAGVGFDVKNEARVHLWYEGKFGYPIKPYTSSRAAIDSFPTTAGCLGICPGSGGLDSYTSFGFDDLLNLVVRPNKRQITHEVYDRKTSRWRELWPKLKIIEWADDQA